MMLSDFLLWDTQNMNKLNLSIKDRFMSYVQKSDDLNDCWNWIGGKSSSGYGAFTINHKKYLAHRVSYALFVDTIPDGMEVCHSCDNKLCVNPSHLWSGTHQDNIDDKVRKNRQSHHTKSRGENNGKNKLTEQNIYQIREMIEQGYTQQKIAEIFGVKGALISKIKLGILWSWLI